MEYTEILMEKKITGNEILGTDSIPVLFRKFTVPAVIGLLFLGVQTIIDGIVIGNFIGPKALASVSLILPCYNLMVALTVVLGIGCQTLVSLYSGKGDRQSVNDALTTAFGFLVLLMTGAAIGIYAGAPTLARWLGANEVLLDGSVAYIRSLILFFPLLGAMFFSDYILKALGYPLYSMLIMGGAVILNIGLDVLFIVRLGWGITGAGLATGLAFMTAGFFSLPFILDKRKPFSVFSGRFRPGLLGQMIYNGSSEGISELSSGVTILLFNITLMKYLGENGVAAFTVIGYIVFIGITVFLGISDGIIPIIGFNLGAGKHSRIAEVLKRAVRTNVIIGTGLFLIFIVFGETIITLFLDSRETEVIRITASGASIYAFAFLLNGLNILASGYFTAIGKAGFSAMISLCRGLIFVAVGLAVFPVWWGIKGIWLTVPLAELGTFVLSAFLVSRSIRKEMKNLSS